MSFLYPQESFSAGELGPKLHHRFRLERYRAGMALIQNFFIEPEACLSKRAGTVFVADVATASARLIPFKHSADEQYVLVFTNLAMKVVKQGQLDFVQSGGSDYSIVTPYTSAYVADLRFVQRNDIMYLLHPLVSVRKLTRVADDNWTLAAVTFAPGISAPTSPSATWSATGAPDTANQDFVYKVTSISEAGEESLPTSAFEDGGGSATAGRNTLSWTAEAAAVRYNVYSEDSNGALFGYIGETDGTSFIDDGIEPDTARTPPEARNPFNASGSYPAVGTIIQQRLALANTVDEPLKVQLSQTASYENFSYSRPQRASDAIEIEVDAELQGEVRAIKDLGGSLVFTSEEIRQLRPATGVALEPGQVDMPIQLRIGCAPIEPLVVLDRILMVEDTGNRVQSLGYDEVYIERIKGRETSILSSHMFRSKRVKRWCYSRSPHSIVPTVFDDSRCSVLTTVDEHDVEGWVEWTTGIDNDDLWLDCTSIREGDRDVPYFLVQRTIDGATQYYLEKLADSEETTIADMVFVDCAATYSGSATTTPTGFDHLEGQSGLLGLADGAVIDSITIASGTISGGLSVAASKVTIGIPLRARCRNLPLPPMDERSMTDTVDARNVIKVYATILNAGTVSAAVELETDGSLKNPRISSPPVPSVFPSGAQIGDRRAEIMIPPAYSRDGQIYLESSDPLPMTLTLLQTEWEYAGPAPGSLP